jgi:hypothetical protein
MVAGVQGVDPATKAGTGFVKSSEEAGVQSILQGFLIT